MLGTLEKLPGEPIIVRTIPSLGSEADMKVAAEAQKKLLDEQHEKVFFIVDMTTTKLDFQDVSVAANVATRATHLYQHSNIRELLVATTNRMLELAFEGLDSEVYGNVKAKVFKSKDAALAYIRAKK